MCTTATIRPTGRCQAPGVVWSSKPAPRPATTDHHSHLHEAGILGVATVHKQARVPAWQRWVMFWIGRRAGFGALD
jgi:hypothetical protein